MKNKKITTKTIRELITLRIIYYRKLQDSAQDHGNFERAQRYKNIRWELEDLLDDLKDNFKLNHALRFYSEE